MRFLLVILLLVPQLAFANNREAGVDLERGRHDIKAFESETQLQRDLLGRKLVIEPGSKIDAGSLNVELAPGSTVIIRANQYDKGVQTVKTPLFRNVEIQN